MPVTLQWTLAVQEGDRRPTEQEYRYFMEDSEEWLQDSFTDAFTSNNAAKFTGRINSEILDKLWDADAEFPHSITIQHMAEFDTTSGDLPRMNTWVAAIMANGASGFRRNYLALREDSIFQRPSVTSYGALMETEVPVN